jgi:hypothetical protein
MPEKDINLSRRTVLSAASLTVASAGISGTAMGQEDDEDSDSDENGDNGKDDSDDEVPETCEGPGFNDTPQLPDSKWRVSDACRPVPPQIDPGKPAMMGSPPSDAEILLGRPPFQDESVLSAWMHPDGSTPKWNVTENYVAVNPGTADIQSKAEFGDVQVHLEWAVPPNPEGTNQEPGNSSVFLMDRYEIQILGNYDNDTYADGYAGAIYAQTPPLVNASRPPGEWQEFDIIFKAPQFANDELQSPAVVTLMWNGVMAQHHTVLNGPVQYKGVKDYSPHPPQAPIRLQEHGSPVRFRNIWYRPLSERAVSHGRELSIQDVDEEDEEDEENRDD